MQKLISTAKRFGKYGIIFKSQTVVSVCDFFSAARPVGRLLRKNGVGTCTPERSEWGAVTTPPLMRVR